MGDASSFSYATLASHYPEAPPLITFVTDIFHPLVNPLTTYTYTTSSSSSVPVSATDEERLPPGGFGLGNAFPQCLGISEQSPPSPVNSSADVSTSSYGDDTPEKRRSLSREAGTTTLSGSPRYKVSVVKILDHVKRAFEDEEVLDGLQPGSVVNPGAWKAWQAHRCEALQGDLDRKTSNRHSAMGPVSGATRKTQIQARHLDEWNWDGVWKERVKRGVDASISEQVLFGAGGGDETLEDQIVTSGTPEEKATQSRPENSFGSSYLQEQPHSFSREESYRKRISGSLVGAFRNGIASRKLSYPVHAVAAYRRHQELRGFIVFSHFFLAIVLYALYINRHTATSVPIFILNLPVVVISVLTPPSDPRRTSASGTAYWMTVNVSSDVLGSLILVPVGFVILAIFITIKCSHCNTDWWKQLRKRTRLLGLWEPGAQATGPSTDDSNPETTLESDRLPSAQAQV
ncbi:MAG: hypothetical protein Q9219_001958 [cf. Caloplaca sp. 3 TL-2023]